MKRRVFFSLFFSLAAVLWLAKLPISRAQQSNAPDSPQVAGTILRTLVYHELTTTQRGVVREYPLISGDGNSILYLTIGDPARVYVTSFDGTNTREIASFPDRPEKTDISYDGASVLTVRGGGTNFGSDVRVYKTGSGPVTVWDKAGIEYPNIRLAPDGNRVFFQLRGDVGEFRQGLYVVDATGGTPQRIASPEQVAGVIGLPAGDVEFFTSGTPGLDVSLDGARVVFVVRAQGMLRVMAGQYAGGALQGLHQILETIGNYGVQYVTISADGSKVGYDITQPTGGNYEVGVINFDNVNGQGKQVIVTSNQITPPQDFPNTGHASYRIFLNRDGSTLLLGATSYLYDTPTRRVLQLGVGLGALSGDPPHVVYDGLYIPSMNAAATRFSYLVKDANNFEQLAACEITTALGSAPNLSNPTIDPPFLLTNGRSTATLTVKATASTGINRVSAAILRNGLDEYLIGDVGPAKPVLLPMGGDVYSNSNVRDRGNNTPPGPRVVRYLAETKTGDNKRHATAIDAESLTLTEQTPLIDVAPTLLEFGDVTVNQSKDLPLTVRNIGGVQLTINSLAIDNARFSTPGTTTPITINAGATQMITVRFSPTATGQQRGTLTMNSSDPARPTVTVALAGNGVSTGGTVMILDHTMTGGPVPGACVKPTVKTSFTTTDTEAIQWTFASGVAVNDAIRWEWVHPNGTIYRTFNYTLAQAAQGQACFWDAIQIAGQQAATLPGNWLVRVFIKGTQVLTENFTITQGGGNCPTVSSISPTSGGVGANVMINGTNLSGLSGVKFANNVAASFVPMSDTFIIATVPNGAVTGPITLSKPNCADVNTPTFTVTGGIACPTVTGINPTSGAAGSTVTITGTNFSGTNLVVFANEAVATFTVNSDTQITATVPNSAVTGPITIIKSGCNEVRTATFTVTQPSGRIVRVVCGSASLGGTLTVPVELVAQGNENALGFSLTFDPAVLGNPQAAKGSDAASSVLNTNSNQVAQGRYGIALALPTSQSFAAGVRQIAVVTFTVSATTSATSTTIGFTDTPILRRVSDANAQILTATYQSDTCATIAILRGYEADVTPRPSGKNDGTVSINDWVMVGRFAAALDTPAAGSEFQRADCAPRNVKGDGVVAVDDWVQAGRYYAALDAVQTVGGPSAPTSTASGQWSVIRARLPVSGPLARAIQQQQRTLRVVNTTFVRGQLNALSVELLAQGDENAAGFSLQFDPNVLSYVSAETGSSASNALLILNTSQTAAGRLGIALALSAGERFAAGTRALVTVRFNAASTGITASTAISFGDQPIRRQMADVNANSLTGTYTNGTINLANAVACVSAASFAAERLASESIIAAFGTGMATTTQSASSVPLPTTLAGTTVRVRDSVGVERLAPLFFVSANQINYQLPQGTAVGAATLTIASGDGTVSTGTMQIARIVPGLFAANANGQGVAAALALRVKTDGSQVYELVSSYDTALQRYVPLPLTLGPAGEQLYLILFGTGARNFSSLSAASAKVGGTDTQVAFIGAVEGLVGLDQLNVGPLPRTLAGRGEVNISLQVDGQAANVVTVSMR
ncbi:MAG: choice-of-anchor D domain-containing protein [Acidobacteria bacterium]|nr:choice-of-anchor D domain-containing protein [Acidobacteriota bacterium]MBI3425447.1 choice-of-anchor D domain-containing protein [Acidobacteriota bacterium]